MVKFIKAIDFTGNMAPSERTGYKVCDAMTRKPISVTPKTTVKEAALLMKEKGVGSLVIKEGDVLKGYATKADFVDKIVLEGKNPAKTTMDEIMTKDVHTITPSADINDAMIKMRDLDLRWLPVVDGEKLVGLLTLKDVLKIQPDLFEIFSEMMQLREAENKPLFRRTDTEGTCDSCNEYFEKLTEHRGEFFCNACYRELRKEE